MTTELRLHKTCCGPALRSSGETSSGAKVPPGVGPDISLFFDGALAEDVTTEPCTQEPVRAHEAGQRPDHGGALRCNTNIT